MRRVCLSNLELDTRSTEGIRSAKRLCCSSHPERCCRFSTLTSGFSINSSSVAVLQLDLKYRKPRDPVKITSNNTNRFAYLVRLTDRVQTSGFHRRTRLIILYRLAVLTSSLAVLKLELCSENR
eukprot:4668792-Pyramimonas_sp.AAC.1